MYRKEETAYERLQRCAYNPGGIVSGGAGFGKFPALVSGHGRNLYTVPENAEMVQRTAGKEDRKPSMETYRQRPADEKAVGHGRNVDFLPDIH